MSPPNNHNCVEEVDKVRETRRLLILLSRKAVVKLWTAVSGSEGGDDKECNGGQVVLCGSQVTMGNNEENSD